MATLYEENVKRLVDEKRKKIQELQQKPEPPAHEIEKLEEEIRILTMLYENYTGGMGAFRRVKGAREQRH